MFNIKKIIIAVLIIIITAGILQAQSRHGERPLQYSRTLIEGDPIRKERLPIG